MAKLKNETCRSRAVATQRMAASFDKIARLAHQQLSPQDDDFYHHSVVSYLYAHAIELSVKAFLMLHKVSDTKLKKYGHNLEAIIYRANSLGLREVVNLDEYEVTIARMNCYYQSKALEYLVTGVYPAQDINEYADISGKLVREIDCHYIKRQYLKLENKRQYFKVEK